MRSMKRQLEQRAINALLQTHIAWRIVVNGTELAVNAQDITVVLGDDYLIVALATDCDSSVLLSAYPLQRVDLYTNVPRGDGQDSVCFLAGSQRITIEPEQAWRYVGHNCYARNTIDDEGRPTTLCVYEAA